MEELLAYFQRAIEQPDSVQPWSTWWSSNSERVRAAFSREDYLRLKHRKLRGARTILERCGWSPTDAARVRPIHTGFCDQCGERLFRMLPGITNEEVVEFGERAGIEQCKQGYWLHPGLYCPNHCTWMLIELRNDTPREDGAVEPGGSEQSHAPEPAAGPVSNGESSPPAR